MIFSITRAYATEAVSEKADISIEGIRQASSDMAKHQHHDVARAAGNEADKGQHQYTVLTFKGNVSSKHPCHLHPWDPKLHDHIKHSIENGAKLVEFTLSFPEYIINPLQMNMSWYYKADVWFRAYNSHGRTLLSLAFNYDILSLLMLTFGVEEKDVQLVDSPPGCFPFMNENEKVRAVLNIMTVDFNVHSGEGSDLGDDPHSCHQIIKDNDGYGEFQFRCCRWKGADPESSQDGRLECTDNKPGKWLKLLHVLIAGVKVATLLFGPLFLQWVVHGESIRKTDYIIRLKDVLTKTLLVKKVRLGGDSTNPDQQREIRQFKKFRKNVKSIPSEEITNVSFDQLQIYVDHRRLMTEQSVPVGLFHFIYENIFMCRIRTFEPFASCCTESIFGSWSKRFLWLKLKKRSECNASCRKFLSWGHLADLFGGLLLLAAIPAPYYVRLIIYYQFEEDEIDDRHDALSQLGLDPVYEYNLLHYLTPFHGILLLMYIMYAVSFLLLAAFRSCNAEKFDNIAVDSIQDLRCIKRTECVRLIVAHLVLPLEKFGVCGLIIGAIYWPIVIPLSIIVTVCYSIPTLYLTGRFLIHGRPGFLRNNPIPTSPRKCHSPHRRRNLSTGVSSFETCLLLDNISPERDETLAERDICCKCKINKTRLYTACVTWLVGLLCILFMYTILVMFSETIGFCVEVFVFTLMGAIVNASSAAKYVMLVFWVVMYSATCYNNMYEKYLKLNKKIFEFIKEKLKEDIRDVTVLREDKQKNTAFKYFSQGEIRRLRESEMELERSDSDDEILPGLTPQQQRKAIAISPPVNTYLDSIEYINDKLHWTINCLLLFVDRKDVPRIPKELFKKICNIEAPGCPGPIYQGLLKATRQFLYMVLFLAFVLIVVMSFGDVYEVSSTNQMLLTLAGGFVPFVVRFVLKPKQEEICLSSYSFEGKIHHIIREFSQIWPVFDLSFTVDRINENTTTDTMPPSYTSGGGAGSAGNAVSSDTLGAVPSSFDHLDGGTMSTAVCGDTLPRPVGAIPPKKDPTHVDLLITIRDDCDDDIPDNLREEPCSFGSRISLNSNANRPSPEDHGGSSSNVNNPTNACLRRMLPNTTDAAIMMRSMGVTTSTQTGDAIRRSDSMGSQTSPGGRPVDLMVDIARGNVRIHNQGDIELEEDIAGGATSNGKPVWSKSSPYRKVPMKEGESTV